MSPRVTILLCACLLTSVAQAQAPDAGDSEALPEAHRPRLSVKLEPGAAVGVGESLKVTLRADAVEGDDVTLTEQTFAPLELVNKHARVEPAKDKRQAFVFELELIGLDKGAHELKGIALRVVTRDGIVGELATDPIQVEIKSLVANEPNAQLQETTQPVSVVQDDYRLIYGLEGLLAALLIAGLAVLGYRYWQRREKPVVPPPPPRPPWEIAIEKLGELRRRKPSVIAQNKGAQFVDEASDVVREYLGGHFGFDALETTTDEMRQQLRAHGASDELLTVVMAYLNRCDLVKFAKVEPDEDALTVVLADAQAIVELRGSLRRASVAAAAAGAAGPTPPQAGGEPR